MNTITDAERLDYRTKYCIIGAGMSGLAAAKNLKELGIPFDLIEQQDEVGGNWYYGSRHSSIYKSTHLISSKTMTAYTDFPFPPNAPDYPHHRQVLDYLRSYARHFGLYDHIEFNTSIIQIERDKDGLWEVTIRGTLRNSAFSGAPTRIYRGVIIANGHLWDSSLPQYPGHFNGKSLHSREYKTPEILKDKRVLIVGGGNSGCDIAVEAAQNATRTLHSTRRGYHYIPKYLFGLPADVMSELSVKLGIPRTIRWTTSRLLIRLLMGDPTRFGLPKPDHKLLQSHPLVNSLLMYYVGQGDILPKGEIEELRGDTVRFKDGTEEPVDLIIYATGYKLSFPFIDTQYLNYRRGYPRLFMHTFHPEYDNLFVIGLLEPDSGVFWMVDYQCQLIARFIRAQAQDQAKAETFRKLKATPERDLRGSQYLDTDRHFFEVEHADYRRRVKKLIASFR